MYNVLFKHKDGSFARYPAETASEAAARFDECVAEFTPEIDASVVMLAPKRNESYEILRYYTPSFNWCRTKIFT